MASQPREPDKHAQNRTVYGGQRNPQRNILVRTFTASYLHQTKAFSLPSAIKRLDTNLIITLNKTVSEWMIFNKWKPSDDRCRWMPFPVSLQPILSKKYEQQQLWIANYPRWNRNPTHYTKETHRGWIIHSSHMKLNKDDNKEAKKISTWAEKRPHMAKWK